MTAWFVEAIGRKASKWQEKQEPVFSLAKYY
jgi:hypothetical protein